MIVYRNDFKGFHNDIISNDIETKINQCLVETLQIGASKSSLRSYHNSLEKMYTVLSGGIIPDDCGISIEYNIPPTGLRIDFMLSGYGPKDEKNIIIIELKQWENAYITNMDGIVNTFTGGHYQNVDHPSYQALTYSDFLKYFNSTVSKNNINLEPCAYLHNYVDDNIIKNPFYNVYTLKAPVFTKSEAVKLQEFVKKFIKKGDAGGNIIVELNRGEIRPAKQLRETLRGIFKKNDHFLLPDEEHLVYESILNIATRQKENHKHKDVIIVQGGPGTGKSVVAIQLLVNLNSRGLFTQYVTKTKAPRDVYFSELVQDHKLKYLKSLFVGSGCFQTAPKSAIKVLVVDEAHRLTKKTGPRKTGDDQIREIINAAVCSVFFIDENQHISIDDYGTISKIKELALAANATIHDGEEFTLTSQFRCNGSNGYLDWLNQSISSFAEEEKKQYFFEYDFKVFDKPEELRDEIFKINASKEHCNKARIVAGYCWNWTKEGQNNSEIKDISIGDNFTMSWNMRDDGGKFIINEKAINQVGCIHTAQGLETDYIGVIIGDDMFFENGRVCTDVMKRADTDHTVFGKRKLLSEDPEYWNKQFDKIIRNTYRVLMTRGIKGCYIYCTNKALRDYFRQQFRSYHRALYMGK